MPDRGFLPSGFSPDARVVFDGNMAEWLTRGQLAQSVAEFAGHLEFPQKALGFIFAFNNAESLIAYLAAIHAGHAVAMLNPELDPILKSRLIELFEPDFLIAPKPLEAIDGYQEVGSPYASQTVLRSAMPQRHPVHPDLALLLSTSGSTGSPKLARLSFHNLEFNARQVIRALRLTEHDRTMITAPIFNALAQSAIHSLLLSGGSFAITRARIVSGEFWETARRAECTGIGGTPFFYQTLDRLDLDSLHVPLLKNFLQTGGRFPEHLATKFHAIAQARGGSLHMMYGQSEAGPRMSDLGPAHLPEAWRSIGVALEGGRLWVQNDGRECAPMEEGEIYYQGPNVMMGYAFGPEDLAKGDQLGGILATGDVGYRDEHGLFYITGRKSRFAKVFGWRVSLDEVEELLAHAGTVAVIMQSERVVICAERPGEILQDAVDQLAARLHLHRSGFEIREIAAIPRLANGKVDYRLLTEGVQKASAR